MSVAVTEVDHPTLLAFLTSGCTTCVEFWNAFADPRSLRVPGGARLVVVTKGEEAESPGRLRKFAPRDVPVVMSSAAWDDYDVPVAPYFAYVDGASATVVGEGAAGSWNHLSDMLAQALADAGFDGRGRRPRRSGGSRERAARADEELLAAGIEPGDPSLYPQPGSGPGSRARAPGPAGQPAREHRGGDHVRHRRGGRRRDPVVVVTVRRVDAREHQPARGAGPGSTDGSGRSRGTSPARSPADSRSARSRACSGPGWTRCSRRRRPRGPRS